MDMRLAVKLMAQSGHCGFYLAVLQTGTARRESFRILPGPRELSMAEAFRRRLRRLD
jgi:MOSC domain-containing protein YiiM